MATPLSFGPEYDEFEIVCDDYGNEISPLDDDYIYWKNYQENLDNPLSDDYCKYDHE